MQPNGYGQEKIIQVNRKWITAKLANDENQRPGIAALNSAQGS
jgi:hypothetical protein